MAANNSSSEIIVRVINEIALDEVLGTGGGGGGVTGGGQFAGTGSSGRGIRSRTLLAGGVRVLAATGQTEVASTIGTVGRYATLGARVISGDPTAIANLAFDLAAKGIEMFRNWQEEEKRKRIERKVSDETIKRKGIIYGTPQRYGS